MKMAFQIATYGVAIILIGLLTFGQDAPPQYGHWIRDGIQACLALALFFSDPKAFIAKMTAASHGTITIPAAFVPINGKIEPPPLKTVVVAAKPVSVPAAQIGGVG